ncbi:hypothetical protein GIB67_016610 [Kingdonia uniflora]|uniref:DUF7806 domain-containing protein n=1 Tax=Kingdonia uniflora TaxID=39325 RepID=A0A7J7MZD4_9MAGN|nr:hypothetical protein GIB67_016610 [Kingdonia uniflora]
MLSVVTESEKNNLLNTQQENYCMRKTSNSGYSFSLRWYCKEGEEEQAEILYSVLSLGTFERVALEWMEDIMFSTSMCPVFFNRSSQVIGLCW